LLALDYTTGPFKIGASYLNILTYSTEAIEIDRYSGGVNLRIRPWNELPRLRSATFDTEEDGPSTDNADGVALLVGTQVEF
jgi:hypothetical protein